MEDDFEIPDEDLQRNEALPQKHQPSIVRKCNSRIDDLSQPNKRIFISLWNEHGHHLPKDKSENLKNILKQMFAMSPVETAKYFRELKAEARRKAAHRELKKEIRKFLANKRKDEDQKRAFIFFQKVLRHLLNYAVKNSIPAILSLKVRYLSDIILEELSNLRKVNVPCRLNPSRLLYNNFPPLYLCL